MVKRNRLLPSGHSGFVRLDLELALFIVWLATHGYAGSIVGGQFGYWLIGALAGLLVSVYPSWRLDTLNYRGGGLLWLSVPFLLTLFFLPRDSAVRIWFAIAVCAFPWVLLGFEIGFRVRMLLNVNARDYNGQTALMKAASEGQTERVRALIEKGADINTKYASVETALTNAASGGHVETVKLLLDCGATGGDTALVFAARDSQREVVKLLIERGIPLDGMDNNCRTALGWAIENGDTETVELLTAADRGDTPNSA